MISMTLRGIAAFVNAPLETLSEMRSAAPGLIAAAMALTAATLVMVVIDLSYGPVAYPHTLEPGGKRSLPYLTIAVIELTRSFGTAATVYLATRWLLRASPTLAEAIWMTVPYAIALILFELVQLSSWILALTTGLNLYGPIFLMGFVGSVLVLVVSVRALVPNRDWLGALPVAAVAFFMGYYAPYIILPVALFHALTLQVSRRS